MVDVTNVVLALVLLEAGWPPVAAAANTDETEVQAGFLLKFLS